MSIIYNPSDLLKKIAPEKHIKKIVGPNLSIKRSSLSMISRSGVVSKERLAEVSLKVSRNYKLRRAKEALESGRSAAKELASEISKDPKLLVQRIQNEIVWQVKEEIKSKYFGEKYRWLPSDADEPDPEHQAKYGEIYVIGDGEMPGDRIGCRCGMEIITDDTTLDL